MTIPYLFPMAKTPAAKKARRDLRQGLFRQVVARATADRDPAELLFEVYLAGLVHGAETIGKHPKILDGAEPRVIDRIDIDQPRIDLHRRRGRPRKDAS